MKKRTTQKLLLAAALGVMAMTVPASAAQTKVDTVVGYSTIDLGNGVTGKGGVIGWDAALPLDGAKIPVKGIEVGLSTAIEGYGLSGGGSGSSLYGMNAEINAGYRFLHEKMKVEAGVGYGYLAMNSLYLTGMQYSTAAQYNFTDKYGIKVSYTKNSFSQSVGDGTIDSNKIGVFLTIRR